MENFGKLWKSMKNYGKIWKSMDNYGKNMENDYGYEKTMKKLWKSMDVQCTDFHDFPMQCLARLERDLESDDTRSINCFFMITFQGKYNCKTKTAA